MRIHQEIILNTDQEFQDGLLKKVKAKKLNKVDFDKRYDVIKIKSKNKNSNIQSFGLIMQRATPCIIGGPEAVALYFSTINEWFHCSEILKCTKYKKFIKIETLNSVYKLVAWE